MLELGLEVVRKGLSVRQTEAEVRKRSREPKPEREVEGVGEVRFGPRGREQARFVAAYLPGAGDHQDTRATAEVDLVLGPQFTALASDDEVAAAVAAGADAPIGC